MTGAGSAALGEEGVALAEFGVGLVTALGEEGVALAELGGGEAGNPVGLEGDLRPGVGDAGEDEGEMLRAGVRDGLCGWSRTRSAITALPRPTPS